MLKLSDLLDRRRFLACTRSGLGAIALASLLERDGLLAGQPEPYDIAIDPAAPTAARRPPGRARAKQVLMIFCSGALSHIDTFDFKPELVKRHGQPMPDPAARVTFQGENGNIAQPLFRFRPRGECGKMLSDLLPALGELADDWCFIHSMTTKSNTHGPGENCMSTGFALDGFPSVGAWVTYALGTENQDLPAFVAIPDPRGVPQASINNWGAGFLPSVFQGTAFNADKPIRHLLPPRSLARGEDAAVRELIARLNDEHLRRFPEDSELLARINSYRLAARMQLSVTEAADLSRESRTVVREYGADCRDNPTKASFARNCLLARRLLERGVRFVQLFNGAYAMGEGVGNWDGHRKLEPQYRKHAAILDQPAAALLRDLKRRGMLQHTLVVFCTEFGRMPMFQKGASGRDHNPLGFTCMLMGGGVRSPMSFGATDELGYKAVQDTVTIHDFHATILHLLGIDHRKLSVYHNGVRRRLTDVHGDVIRQVIS
ncbi:MAG: DUF1501 domain-containing protein [Planctomycetota bacterium]|nr:MAG: DUF1501 domain-containing protein [Planctomycetota bacterium]